MVDRRFACLRPVGLEPTMPIFGHGLKVRYNTNSAQGRAKKKPFGIGRSRTYTDLRRQIYNLVPNLFDVNSGVELNF